MPHEGDDRDVMCADCGAPHGPGDPCRCNALCHQDGNHHLCKSCGGTGLVNRTAQEDHRRRQMRAMGVDPDDLGIQIYNLGASPDEE